MTLRMRLKKSWSTKTHCAGQPVRNTRKIGIVVQVRLSSTRLPRKALVEISGKPLLQRLCERMQLCRNADDLIVATSNEPQDQAIEDACRSWGIAVCRGPEADLTTRLLDVAKARSLDALVRVTGDNPLTDPEGIDEMIRAFQGSFQGDVAIIHNAHRKGYPYGTGAEIATRSLLEICDRELVSRDDRENFMESARRRGDRFKCLKLHAPLGLLRPDYFLTVDYSQDLVLQEKICAHFQGRDARLEEIIALLDANPELPRLNSHLHQQFAE
ncbi:MAG: cytidylyltransferase domain-containing protein [Candidatus Acidiferrales bacterium]